MFAVWHLKAVISGPNFLASLGGRADPGVLHAPAYHLQNFPHFAQIISRFATSA